MACFMGSQQTEQVVGGDHRVLAMRAETGGLMGGEMGGHDNKAPWLKATWELQSRGTEGTNVDIFHPPSGLDALFSWLHPALPQEADHMDCTDGHPVPLPCG